MSIAPISAKSDRIYSPLGDNNAIKLLEKQKLQLQEQIQAVNDSKSDDKTKLERVKQLQEQIQQIDVQIQQKRSEKLNQNQNANQQTVNSQPNVSGSGDDSHLADMSSLVQASATYSQAEIMNNTKNSLNRNRSVLEIEIKLDESRGGDTKAKRAQVQEIESKEQVLDKKFGEATQTVQSQMKEAAKDESENSGVNNDSTKSPDDIGIENIMQETNVTDKERTKFDVKI